MQAHGHAAVVIIIFMVRGGLESCLSTVITQGLHKSGTFGQLLSIISFARMGIYKPTSILGVLPLEARDSLVS